MLKNFTMLTFKNGFQEHRTAKASDAEGTRFVTVCASDWNEWHTSGYSGRHRSCCAISRQSHASSCNSRIIVHVTVKTALGFASCNYLTVTGTIILKLHSNVCDYLYYITPINCFAESSNFSLTKLPSVMVYTLGVLGDVLIA